MQKFVEFPVTTPPVRSGVYQTKLQCEEWHDNYYQYYCVNTNTWYTSSHDPDKALYYFKNGDISKILKSGDQWRGILK